MARCLPTGTIHKKTRRAFNEKGWATYGDMGYVDAEGYLYLADRRTDLILSGGVNVLRRSKTRSPCTPMCRMWPWSAYRTPPSGKFPRRSCELRDPAHACEDKALELIAFCEGLLSRVKMPRTIVFEENLPRLETGKLLRRVLKEKYQAEPDAGHRAASSRVAGQTAGLVQTVRLVHTAHFPVERTSR